MMPSKLMPAIVIMILKKNNPCVRVGTLVSIHINEIRYSSDEYSLQFFIRSDDPTLSYMALKLISPDKIFDVRT